MQRITDEMARDMLRQMIKYDDHVTSCATNLLDAENHDADDAEVWRAIYESAKACDNIWLDVMRALGVDPTISVDTGDVSGAIVRRDGKDDFVALD